MADLQANAIIQGFSRDGTPSPGALAWWNSVRKDLPSALQDTQSPTFSLSIGSVVSGPDAAAEITGSGESQVLNLTLPQGQAGQPTAYEMRGTGMPSGVVTAAPGTYYTDTSFTSGAYRWVKKYGTDSNGWTVQEGDTGWRNITPSTLPPAITAGSFYLRRVNSTVTLKVTGLTWASGQTAPLNVFPSGLSIGASGFAHSSSDDRTVVYISDPDMMTYDALVPYLLGGTLYLRYMWTATTAGTVTSTSTRGRTGSMQWTTDDLWPSSLPGTSA